MRIGIPTLIEYNSVKEVQELENSIKYLKEMCKTRESEV